MKNRLIRLLFLWPVVFSAGLLAQTVDDYVNSGKKKSLAGDLDAAITDFNRALEAAPQSVPAYSGRGLAKRRKGDLDGAIADFNRALEIDPRFVLALSDRGFCKMNLGDLDGALADFVRAFELSPENADRRNSLGIVKQLKGDFVGAIADYDKAIALKPGVPAYPRMYRELLVRRAGRATRDFGQEVETWQNSWPKTVGRYVAGSLDEAGFLAAAGVGDEKMVREQECRAAYFIGMTRLIAGDQNGAREYFQKSLATGLKLFNEHSLARAELARLGAGGEK